MRKIYIFGDSFSCKYNLMSPEYVKWKNYVPKTFGDILSEKLKIENINYSVPGSDNYTIFHSIFKNIHQIKKNDIIVIGWSTIERFRLASDYDFWSPIFPYTIDIFEKTPVSNLSKNTVNEILNNRTSPLYIDELNDLISIINYVFKKNLLINWSWVNFNEKINLELPYKSFNGITNETNYEIKDGHFNELDSMNQAEILIKYILNNKL